ncbi:helix-turn-helix transcriptional regulator [Rubellimicrobium aerolatum]|uniref:Helix-turn-helix transcriptional regulator n=1 Tax=Rubellimicrobium aerolatum TaxID=490979 RepID=A0ABW0S939_9RHOB|nr:helix-turn-helix transcriptional regulator [Rubellimicrobium aerolatum]MBP1804781.1 DNA-binding CsgD family transcriptional regulator [Rubellimicrobium aerolatum]
MRVDPTFSDLVGRIYDCSLDKDLWPAVLGEICGVLNGKLADISVSDPLGRSFSVQASHGWEPELLARVIRHAPINPALPHGLVHPVGEPWCGSREMGVDRFRRSLYWRTCMEGQGTLDLVAVMITRKASEIGFWEVTGGEERGVFSDEDLDFARAITPHIRRAVEISGLIRNQAGTERSLHGMLERLSAAALIVAPDGTIRFRNAAAEAELRDGSFVREAAGRLVGARAEVARLLAHLGDHPMRQDGCDLVVANAAGRRLHVTWACLDRVAEAADAPFLVLLRSPEPDLRTPLGLASELYGLTRAETETLAQMLEGRSLDEAGAVLGVARSTVKTHLDGLFAKTGTRRQAELVARVMGLVTALR